MDVVLTFKSTCTCAYADSDEFKRDVCRRLKVRIACVMKCIHRSRGKIM